MKMSGSGSGCFWGTFLLAPPSSGNGANTGSGDKSGKGWMTSGGMAGGAVMKMSGVVSCFRSSPHFRPSPHFGDEVWTGSTSIFKRNQSKFTTNFKLSTGYILV